MVDSNEVHHWRWIIWGVGINYQALKPKLLSFFLPIHHDESLWIHTKQLDLGKHQAKPSSSSKGMLQPSLFVQKTMDGLQEEKTTACLIQASGIPSIFTLVGTLIAASASVCPVKSNAAASCAKAWRDWGFRQNGHKPHIKW